MKRIIGIIGLAWFVATGFVAADPVRKTIRAGEFEREYLIYTPQHPHREKADGLIVCLHGFGRSMNDFFGQYNITALADLLNLIIVAPQALPEQDTQVHRKASIISSVTDNQISLHSVWGCGLRIRVTLAGLNLLNEELNKEVDDVQFIDQVIDETLLEYALPAENLFVFGTSMGGFMTYQYALKKGERLSGIISIAGSMGLNVKGMDYVRTLPVCDFHSVEDEVVPYAGSYEQLLSVISLAKPKADVISYWTETNSTGEPVTEQIRYYPSTNGITVEKITYPNPENEVVHYKINGASHSYFFRKENGDCMDHVEEITRFIQSHFTKSPDNNLNIAEQKLSFYPNPVYDKVYFSATSGVVSIFDIAGRKIFSRSFTDGRTDLSLLKPGIYIIQIQSGNTVQVGKLIKK